MFLKNIQLYLQLIKRNERLRNVDGGLGIIFVCMGSIRIETAKMNEKNQNEHK